MDRKLVPTPKLLFITISWAWGQWESCSRAWLQSSTVGEEEQSATDSIVNGEQESTSESSPSEEQQYTTEKPELSTQSIQYEASTAEQQETTEKQQMPTEPIEVYTTTLGASALSTPAANEVWLVMR